MKKIPTLFKRNYETDRLVRNEITPGCEWVIEKGGIVSEKFDGTCCLIGDGKLFKRYELKRGKTAPVGFEPAQDETDPETGDMPGWIPVGDGPEDQWHREGLASLREVYATPQDGTYELVGPKIQGNLYGKVRHTLIKHGDHKLNAVPREFEALRDYLESHYMEGIVWTTIDGRMAKLKRSDFGLAWGSKKAR